MVIPSLELHVPRDALSLQAFFVPVGSVRLELWDIYGSFLHHQIENYEPYALFADSGGKYNAGPTGIPLRDNILKATVYSEKGAKGDILKYNVIRFNVIDASSY